MQEKSYDSKSDIWSLGCLIYELCALKPPFHEAKTHSELNIFIRYGSHLPFFRVVYFFNKNGRIPPLPRGYSQALTSIIKSMLSLNVSFPNFLQIPVTNSASSPLCARLPLNFSNMNDSNYSTDSLTLRKCETNQTPSKLGLNPFSGSGSPSSKVIATP